MRHIVQSQLVQKEIDNGTRHELARLLRGIDMAATGESIADWPQLRGLRSFQIKMATLADGLHSYLLQSESLEIIGVDQKAINEPEREEQKEIRCADETKSS